MTEFNRQPVLSGPTISVKPLSEDDFDGLFACGGDQRVWAGHPNTDRYKLECFKEWFASALESGGAITVTENSSNQIIGSSRYYFDETPAGGVAIGFTFLAYRCWGGKINAELKQLMLDHAFNSFDTVWFHVASSNIRSQKAMQKVGATLAGEQQLSLGGSSGSWFLFRMDKQQ